MKEEREILVCSNDKSIQKCILTIEEVPCCVICFTGLQYQNICFKGDDLFEALVYLREELEKESHLLLCNGARKDVYPSAMSREMSNGRKAYINRIGCYARKSDIINIFDRTELQMVSTVMMQKEYHENWFASLKK